MPTEHYATSGRVVRANYLLFPTFVSPVFQAKPGVISGGKRDYFISEVLNASNVLASALDEIAAVNSAILV